MGSKTAEEFLRIHFVGFAKSDDYRSDASPERAKGGGVRFVPFDRKAWMMIKEIEYF